ncbi:unnamed protein product, partial [Gulo gulo]
VSRRRAPYSAASPVTGLQSSQAKPQKKTFVLKLPYKQSCVCALSWLCYPLTSQRRGNFFGR